MSFAKSTLVVALLALMTGCGSVGMVTSSTKLGNGGASTGAPLMNGPAMNSPHNVERTVERVETSARSTPREPLFFRVENCTRCN